MKQYVIWMFAVRCETHKEHVFSQILTLCVPCNGVGDWEKTRKNIKFALFHDLLHKMLSYLVANNPYPWVPPFPTGFPPPPCFGAVAPLGPFVLEHLETRGGGIQGYGLITFIVFHMSYQVWKARETRLYERIEWTSAAMSKQFRWQRIK